MTWNPQLFTTFGKNWYAGSFESLLAFPKKILLSSSFSGVSAPAMAVYDTLFGLLADFLGASANNFSIAAEWNATSGTGVPINTFLNAVCTARPSELPSNN